MKNDIPIYSFIAYSGTGKTTLLEKLVAQLKSRGFRVAVMKHDAHDFDIDHPGKDSRRLTQAGADVTVIASKNRTAIMENRTVSFDDVHSRIRDVDIILTEGYNHGDWPKIGVVRSETGKPLKEIKGDYYAVVTDTPCETTSTVIDINDIEGLADLVIRGKQSE